ncbi:glycoside hydrolase family 18 protein [Calocera viscosa TUFC12733]|uniref:chitinase n=1 Tax=Calocera viscosa (strain TUFC12733) TaxID=1330018 RepID=A0A167S3X8_CALVF|nr:glycoside hydrolase family 18 protein [Calocera viscosa TUFC12733]
MAGSNFASSFIATIAVLALVVGTVDATEVMHRPSNYLGNVKYMPHGSPSSRMRRQVTRSCVGKRAGGYVNAAYFGNWDIYGRAYMPMDVPASEVTHLLYGFADVNPSTGEVILSDTYADQQKHYPNDSWNDVGNNLYGNFKQFYLMKKQNRSFKVMLSIGGWTYSQAGHFDPVVVSPTLRAKFVSSSISLLEDNGLDGIDIDYEYPNTDATATGFTALLTELRAALDAHQASKGDKVSYLLSAAVSAGSENYASLQVAQMDPVLDFWNLMAYDYAGSWSSLSGNDANLYGGDINTDSAIKWYLSQGATSTKMNMGIPIYGRSFENTNGLNDPYSGIGQGTWEAGVWDYRDLPLLGAQVVEDLTTVSSYSYDSKKKELISYDTPNIVQAKAKYILQYNLAGAMFWEVSADATGSKSLIGTTAGVFGKLDQTQNHLDYPGSQFANMAAGMPDN